MKIWQGTPPKKCDICQRNLVGVFVDGKTQMGPWAIMCLNCSLQVGIGLGVGRGQRYRSQNGSWVKVAG